MCDPTFYMCMYLIAAYQAWHSLAFMNFEALLLTKQASQQRTRHFSLSKELTVPDKMSTGTTASPFTMV